MMFQKIARAALCAAIAGVALISPAIAAEVKEVAPDTSRLRRLVIQSDVLGETRPVELYLPKAYGRSNDAYPVIYALDGEESFHYAAGALDALYQRGFPKMLLVSIPNTKRSRDLMPEA